MPGIILRAIAHDTFMLEYWSAVNIILFGFIAGNTTFFSSRVSTYQEPILWIAECIGLGGMTIYALTKNRAVMRTWLMLLSGGLWFFWGISSLGTDFMAFGWMAFSMSISLFVGFLSRSVKWV
jgi:hypothetical protein